LGVDLESVRAFGQQIETAAYEFDSDFRSPTRAPPSLLSRRLKRIEGAAWTLLHRLGVKTLEDAPDGPADAVLKLLAGATKEVEDGEHAVTVATGRVGLLVEIIGVIEATKELARRAATAAEDAISVGLVTVPKGNAGDWPVNNWIDTMLSIYEQITGKRAGTSVAGEGHAHEGEASGPLIRFLTIAGAKLAIEMCTDAWRSRIRAILQTK
jgi:hypothetical protein